MAKPLAKGCEQINREAKNYRGDSWVGLEHLQRAKLVLLASSLSLCQS